MDDAPRKIRVLLLLAGTAGDAGRHAYYLARHLPPRWFEVALAFTRSRPGEESMDGPIGALGLPVTHLDGSASLLPVESLGQSPQLKRLLTEEHFDIVCAYNEAARYLKMAAKHPSHPAACVQIIQQLEPRPRGGLLGKVIGALGAKRDHEVARDVVISEALRDEAIERKIIDETKASVIHPGIPMEELNAEQTRAIRNELEIIGAQHLAIGTIARLDDETDLECLLQASLHLKSVLGNASILIAGDGPKRDHYLTRIPDLGLGGMVRLIGRRAAPTALFASYDIVYLPVRDGMLPYALLEAMAAGRPCVVPRIGAVGDIVEDGRTGLLVEPGDPASLAAALERLLGNERLRRRMGEAARRHVEENFTIETMIRRFAELLTTLAGAAEKKAHSG